MVQSTVRLSLFPGLSVVQKRAQCLAKKVQNDVHSSLVFLSRISTEKVRFFRVGCLLAVAVYQQRRERRLLRTIVNDRPHKIQPIKNLPLHLCLGAFKLVCILTAAMVTYFGGRAALIIQHSADHCVRGPGRAKHLIHLTRRAPALFFPPWNEGRNLTQHLPGGSDGSPRGIHVG